MLGGLLGDFAKGDIASQYNREMGREILIHRKIDSFTDNHRVVRAARQEFDQTTRRYAGILLDVFYDHVLIKNWSSYSSVPLHDFIGRFYDALVKHDSVLPARLSALAPMMIEQNWLASYQEFSGVEVAISRMSGRLSKNGHLLRDGLLDLRTHYASLCSGFDEFFPELIEFAQTQRAMIDGGDGPFGSL